MCLLVEEVHIAEKVKGDTNIVGGVSAEGCHTDGEEGLVVEDDQAVHDQLKRVVILVCGHPVADRCENMDVALPHHGHGDGKHPLDVERTEVEEDGEGPVLDAHHDDVQGCEVVPPEVQVEITKDIKIVKIFKIERLNLYIVPPQALSKAQIMSPGFGQLEMGDTEDCDHLDSMYSVLNLEAVASQSCKT